MDPANATITVLLLIYNYAFGNSLGGDYGDGHRPEPHARRCSSALFSAVYFRLTRRWSTS